MRFLIMSAMMVGLFWSTPASAEDCLLDTNNDGAADSNVDTDLGANSNGDDSALACGKNARAMAANAIAIGLNAFAEGASSLAAGHDSSAGSLYAVAVGTNARSPGSGGLAFGTGAFAAGVDSTSLGRGATSSGNQSIAIGSQSRALGNYAVAVGRNSLARDAGSIAIGDQATARGANATALGAGAAVASGHHQSSALGAGAITTRANQVMIGGSGSSVTIGDLDASTAAQVGPLDIVTVDADGTLGRGSAASSAYVDRLAAGFADTLMGQGESITVLEERIAILEADRKGLDGGIAAAAALGSAIPLAHDGLTLSVNAAAHKGEQALATSLTGRINRRVAIGVGVAANTGDDSVTAQVGFSLGL